MVPKKGPPMKKSLIALTSAMVALAMATAVQAQTPRSYTVNFTENPPSIDGERGAGEWDDAEPATGDFTLLREPANTPSPENLSFQALFDENYLYLIVETDFSDYQGAEYSEDTKAPPLVETLELFIDPNRDNLPNVEGTDGNSYQFLIPLVPGGPDIRVGGEAGPPFYAPLARYNNNFGDNVDGGWWPEVSFARTVADGATVVEYRFPFSQFNAVIGTDETSLNASFAHPADGDVWMFNVGRISSATAPNNLPVWSWHPGQFFSMLPRGEITFSGGPPPPTSADDFELYQ